MSEQLGADRVLRILAVAPWTPSSRRPRSLRLLTMLSDVHVIHLVCVAWSDEDMQDAGRLPFPVTAIRIHRVRGLLGATWAFFKGSSLQQGFVTSRRLGQALRHVAQSFSPDVFYFNVARSAHLLSWIRGMPGERVIDLDELRSGYYGQMREISRNLLWRQIARVEAPRLSRAEADIRRNFDRVLFSSPLDVDKWQESAVLVRSPTRFNMTNVAHDLSASRRSVVFVGRLGYRANFEAIKWFVENIWPMVVAEFDDVDLFIVGEKPGRAIRRLESETVHVTGRVSEVDPYYFRAVASIVPVRMATGVQLKLIEAMSAGTLAIVSPIVAQGAGVQDGRQVLVADSDRESWMSAIRLALTDSARVNSIRAEASLWVAREYDDSVIKASLLRGLVSE